MTASTLARRGAANSSSRLGRALRAVADEAVTLLAALANPGRIIREVEAMRALQVEANRIEATDPEAAAALRRRAARIGLRR